MTPSQRAKKKIQHFWHVFYTEQHQWELHLIANQQTFSLQETGQEDLLMLKKHFTITFKKVKVEISATNGLIVITAYLETVEWIEIH